MKVLEKLFCGHKWKKIEEINVYDGIKRNADERPMYEKSLWLCELCGKFKIIKL